MQSKILILDRDCGDKTLGLLTVENAEVCKVQDIFVAVKMRLPGLWSLEDLLDGLKDEGIDFSFEYMNNIIAI